MQPRRIHGPDGKYGRRIRPSCTTRRNGFATPSGPWRGHTETNRNRGRSDQNQLFEFNRACICTLRRYDCTSARCTLQHHAQSLQYQPPTFWHTVAKYVSPHVVGLLTSTSPRAHTCFINVTSSIIEAPVAQGCACARPCVWQPHTRMISRTLHELLRRERLGQGLRRATSVLMTELRVGIHPGFDGRVPVQRKK